MIAQCHNEKGISQTFYADSIPSKELILTYKEVCNFIKGDDAVLEYTKNYENAKFLEVDFVINESSLLSKLYLNRSNGAVSLTYKIEFSALNQKGSK